MFNTFNFMAINRCCILGGPYYPTYIQYHNLRAISNSYIVVVHVGKFVVKSKPCPMVGT